MSCRVVWCRVVWCAGIYGGNETGSYEDLFCKDVPQRGLVVLGDSATAHFHIPPQW
jgi:acyloxyacyl hydrolase